MPITELTQLCAQLPPGKRLMGIDHSKKAWGLAVSTPDLGMATPLSVITAAKFSDGVAQLADLCREYKAGGFVIGLPLNMDDSEGPRAQSVRHFADNLIAAKDKLGFEPVIAFFDERLSTAAVEDFLQEHKVPPHKRAAAIDKLAARMILQGALDALVRMQA